MLNSFVVCRLFEQEKTNHVELKQTWKMANEQFLDQQTKLSFELEFAKKLLTPQQLEQVSKEIRQKRALMATAEQEKKQQEPSPSPKTQKQRNELVADFDPLSGKGKSQSKETLIQKAARSPASKLKSGEKPVREQIINPNKLLPFTFQQL